MHIRSGQVPDIFGKHLNAKGMMPIVLDMRASQGVTLVDGLTGKPYLDFFGFLPAIC